tara:strand:+ start:130 stop:267 length:138 start_codon:yes stop_codon:yes gene_type:complete
MTETEQETDQKETRKQKKQTFVHTSYPTPQDQLISSETRKREKKH